MVLALICAYCGWWLLYRAMSQSLSSLGSRSKAGLRGVGAMLLVCALGASVWQWGASVGFAAWWILLALSAWSLTIIMAFRRHIARMSG